MDKKPSNWGDRLSLFVGHLIQQNHQSSTVHSYISAIKAVLKMNNIRITEDQFLLASLTKACRLKNDRMKTRLPIQKGMLSIILKQTEIYFLERAQPYLGCLFQTLFSTVYFGLLRVNEMTKNAHPILAKDVHIGANKKKFLLVLRTSKTHGLGSAPQIVKISAKPMDYRRLTQNTVNLLKPPCPYTMLKKYAGWRGPYVNDVEPFFIFRDRSPVSAQQVSSYLKLMIHKCGFDDKLYGTHSLR